MFMSMLCWSGASKGCLDCSLACVLFPVIHLLQELLGLLLVNEGQTRQAVFKLESVEEDTILVVPPCVVNLLIPYHTSVSGLFSC